ncbi:protein SSXA1-like [Peromyscus eremicus]|uniref:protein SSXA1-like n=1 Tax=Peromyscus eremicus TaxID=42410 RepID=UPI0027DD4A12|nr:protein SSXA1-like [Peromyscus eremicus]
MKTDTSCTKSPVEDTCKPEKMSKSFRDISKYFSEEEWAKLTKWQKSAYVFMKRNYIRMTGLGIKVNQPVFMRGKEFLMKESDEDYGHECDGQS